MLQITNFKKAYDAKPVLTIPSLQLTDGVYWLKGDNGTGKSTLLRSMAGLIPFEGDVAIQQISLKKQRMTYTKLVSFAEAEPVYPPFLSGSDLVRFYEEVKGKLDDRTRSFMNLLELPNYLHQKVSTYSSGMLKKLSLVLAFAGKPKLILLDEPFITLDVAAVSFLQEAITCRSLKGCSFLISSHQELRLDVPVGVLQIHQQTLQVEKHVFAAG